MATNYVDKKEFLRDLTAYRLMKISNPSVVCPDKVAEYFLTIARNIATLRYFSGYPFIEDMIMDAVMYCLKYVDNFNPDKSSEPFSYFTQVIRMSFLRFIKQEYKQKNIETALVEKEKLLLNEIKICGNKYYREHVEEPKLDDEIDFENDLMKNNRVICWEDKLVVNKLTFLLTSCFNKF